MSDKYYVTRRDTENLCDSCEYCISECGGDVSFGNGLGFDNVIRCDSYAGDNYDLEEKESAR